MKTGISTGCLYPALTEKSLKLLLDNGFDLFEIFFNTFSELEPDFLDRLKFLCDSKNAKIVSIHPFTSVFESYLLFSAYERRFWDGVKMYHMYFRSAKRLGAEYVVLHGMFSNYSSIDDEEYCRRFGILSDTAAEYGITFLQENVFNFQSGDKDFIRNMADRLGSKANFVLDTKQARRCGYDPGLLAEIMGSSLRHIHISDCKNDELCLLPGTGEFDFQKFYSTLHRIGYNGDCVIEVYGQKDNDISRLLKAKQYLDALT